MECLKCQRFPNNEIRITRYRDTNSIPPRGIFFLDEQGCDRTTCHPRKTLNGGRKDDEQRGEDSAGTSGYGRMGKRTDFSTYGRRRVLRAGAALEKSVRKQECYMVTLTIPGSTKDSLRTVAAYSSYLVQRFKAWVGKRVKTNLSLYCWEWQKRGALHLHMVIHMPDKEVAEYISKNLKAEWTRLLNAISERSGVDVWKRWDGSTWKNNPAVLRVECEPVKKSVAAYLAKYISKGSSPYKGFGANYFYPTRWYGISRPLSALTKEMTEEYIYITAKTSEAESLYEECISIVDIEESLVHQWRHKIGNGKTTVAYIQTQQVEKIWSLITMTVPSSQSLDTTSCSQSLAWCKTALSLMKKRQSWQDCFSQLSSGYVKNIISRLRDSQQVSGLDVEYLMDSLLYAARYVQRTRSYIEGDVQSLISTGTELQQRFAQMTFQEKLDVTLTRSGIVKIDTESRQAHSGTRAYKARSSPR